MHHAVHGASASTDALQPICVPASDGAETGTKQPLFGHVRCMLMLFFRTQVIQLNQLQVHLREVSNYPLLSELEIS